MHQEIATGQYFLPHDHPVALDPVFETGNIFFTTQPQLPHWLLGNNSTVHQVFVLARPHAVSALGKGNRKVFYLHYEGIICKSARGSADSVVIG